jgi:hypothetical protein
MTLALLNSIQNMLIIVSIRHESSKELGKKNYLALLLARLLALLMMKLKKKKVKILKQCENL